MANDLTIYSDYAEEWWQEGSPRFRSLQNITPFRIKILQDWFGTFVAKDIVDLGCGGGLIAIPLIKGGARMTGIDLSGPSIYEARKAAKGRGTFIVSDIRDVPLRSNSADLVILADVLDHIPDYGQVVKEAARILRPGGSIFVSTINRNLVSWFFAIFLGEKLRLIPPGTHDYRLFIRPEELVESASRAGLEMKSIQGEWPNILETIKDWTITFRRSDKTLIAYSVLFQKCSGTEN